MMTNLIIKTDLYPVWIWRPQVDGAHAADRQRFQNSDSSTARSCAVSVCGHPGALCPLVVLLEKVEGFPCGQDGQWCPNVLWGRKGKLKKSKFWTCCCFHSLNLGITEHFLVLLWKCRKTTSRSVYRQKTFFQTKFQKLSLHSRHVYSSLPPALM